MVKIKKTFSIFNTISFFLVLIISIFFSDRFIDPRVPVANKHLLAIPVYPDMKFLSETLYKSSMSFSIVRNYYSRLTNVQIRKKYQNAYGFNNNTDQSILMQFCEDEYETTISRKKLDEPLRVAVSWGRASHCENHVVRNFYILAAFNVTTLLFTLALSYIDKKTVKKI